MAFFVYLNIVKSLALAGDFPVGSAKEMVGGGGEMMDGEETEGVGGNRVRNRGFSKSDIRDIIIYVSGPVAQLVRARAS